MYELSITDPEQVGCIKTLRDAVILAGGGDGKRAFRIPKRMLAALVAGALAGYDISDDAIVRTSEYIPEHLCILFDRAQRQVTLYIVSDTVYGYSLDRVTGKPILPLRTSMLSALA